MNLLHYSHLLTVHGLLAVVGLLTYALTTHSLGQRRAPTAAISWTLSIALVPYIGLPVYLLFGTRKLVHAANRGRAALPVGMQGVDAAWPRLLTASMGQPPAATYEDLRLHAEGHHALQALWELIDSADRELLICTFLIGRDAVGRALMARLMDKARAGVRVRLLIDGSGHLMGGGVSLRKLKAAGVEVVVYGPLLHVPFRSRVNLRNHRKLVVVDGARLWCGGRNFAVEYFDGSNRHGRWRDLTFDVRGALALQARALFERDWAFSARRPAAAGPLSASPQSVEVEAAPLAQVIAAGPDESDDTVHDLLVSACFKAKRHVMAVTPYFVPGPALLMALSLAARRGVTVDVVLPAHSNHRIADFVRYRAMRELAAAGGRIWLSPSMLHAKAVVIDDSLALAGSANLDARSMFLNYEVMVAFYDGGDIRRFGDFIEKHRASAAPYQARKPGLLRDLGEGLLLWLAFQL